MEINVMALVKEAKRETLTGNQVRERLALMKSEAVREPALLFMMVLMTMPEDKNTVKIIQSNQAKAMIFLFLFCLSRVELLTTLYDLRANKHCQPRRFSQGGF